MSKITALPVERNSEGAWTHPEYSKLCGDREFVPGEEFEAWIKANGLEWDYECRDETLEFLDDVPYESEFAEWEPQPPAGDGWFIGSIHDSDEGPVCVWFRKTEGAAA